MVAKNKTTRTPPALSDESDCVAGEFLLKDYQVLRLISERFIAPEIALHGTYQVRTDIRTVFIPAADELPEGRITYEVILTGNKKPDEGSTESVKSLSITIELEGKFDINDCVIDSSLDLKVYLPSVIQQLHVLAIDKIREAAFNLGYKGVRPHLGLHLAKASHFTFEEVKPKRLSPPRKRAKKSAGL